jgi:hypothetical protein
MKRDMCLGGAGGHVHPTDPGRGAYVFVVEVARKAVRTRLERRDSIGAAGIVSRFR